MSDRESILVVGIGNPYRCDDGVGPRIAAHLRTMLPEKVDVLENIKDGLSLMNLWEKYDCVYLIDAVSSGRAPGQVYRFNALADPLPEKFFTNYSTHSINIPEIIALAKNLDSLPEELIIYGVEGKNFSIGTELSREVRKASAAVADYIIKDMRIDDVAKSP
jgi:hydrogenase maturation protease